MSKLEELEVRVNEARKSRSNFDRLMHCFEKAIDDFFEDIANYNNKPSTSLLSPISASFLHIYIPAIPITPTENLLFREYFYEKYLNGKEKVFAGTRFIFEKCLLRNAYVLKTLPDYISFSDFLPILF